MTRTTTVPLLLFALVALGTAVAPRPTTAAEPTESLPTAPQPLAECEVIARVNNEVILACDLAWQVELMLQQRLGPMASQESPQLTEIRREQLKQLTFRELEMVLLYGDFLSNAPGADIPAIHKTLATAFEEREVPRLVKMTGAKDRAELERKLRAAGTSLEERRQQFFRTVIARQWVNQSIEYDKEVTHEQMLEYYQANLKAYHMPHRVLWEELLVSYSKHPSKGVAYAKLAELGNRVHAAAASAEPDQPVFEQVAKAESDGFTADKGGQQDWTSQGALAAKEVDEALFSLPPGQMSPIIEGPLGFHIVRVLDRKEAGPKPFSEVQVAIKKGLHGERFNAAVEKKLAELKSKAYMWTVFTGDLSSERLAQLLGGGETKMR